MQKHGSLWELVFSVTQDGSALIQVGGDLRQDLLFSKLSSFSPGKGDHISIHLLRTKEQAVT